MYHLDLDKIFTIVTYSGGIGHCVPVVGFHFDPIVILIGDFTVSLVQSDLVYPNSLQDMKR